MEKTWRAAIIRVLQESGSAMHYSDIAEEVLTKNYYAPEGATPAATVNAQISASIKAEGEQSPYRRVSPGMFTLASILKAASSQIALPVTLAVTSTPETEAEVKPKIINAFGMYWQRENVIWKKTPKLYGRAPGGAVSIDFSSQRGVYRYDHRTLCTSEDRLINQ